MTPALERLLSLAEIARLRIKALSPTADALVFELGEAIREVENACEWQPIETAPKVGRDKPLLAQCGEYYGLIFWSTLYNDWVHYWDGEPSREFPPTLWMTLPDMKQENGE